MSNFTYFTITFDVKADHLASFNSVLKNVQESLPNVEGCISVFIYVHDDAIHQFTLLEKWKSKQAHQAHVASLQQSGDWAAIENMLDSNPNGYYLSQI